MEGKFANQHQAMATASVPLATVQIQGILPVFDLAAVLCSHTPFFGKLVQIYAATSQHLAALVALGQKYTPQKGAAQIASADRV